MIALLDLLKHEEYLSPYVGFSHLLEICLLDLPVSPAAFTMFRSLTTLPDSHAITLNQAAVVCISLYRGKRELDLINFFQYLNGAQKRGVIEHWKWVKEAKNGEKGGILDLSSFPTCVISNRWQLTEVLRKYHN